MAKLLSIYTIHERVVDKDGNDLAYYDENLPHGDVLADAFVKDWNKAADEYMLDLINKEVGKDRIASIYARRYQKNGAETKVAVEVVAKPGKQFRWPIKDNVFDFLSAQYCDGWGEGFFGLVNVMTAPDGAQICAE